MGNSASKLHALLHQEKLLKLSLLNGRSSVTATAIGSFTMLMEEERRLRTLLLLLLL